MKIIHITPAYKPAYIYGGPTMSVAKLCEALVQFGENLEVEVLTTTANGAKELNVEPNKQVNIDHVPVTYFKRITKDHTHFSPALLVGLRKKIKEQKTKSNQINSPLIIHIHSWWNLVTIFSCFIAKMYGVPVVLSPRGMLTNYTQNNKNSIFKSILHVLFGKSLLKYSHIIASSEQEEQDVLEITNPKSITIIPNLVSLSSNRIQVIVTDQETTINNSPFKLLFLSRIEEKKGLDILFSALALIDLSWELKIAGAGEESYVEQLKNQAKELHIDKAIAWLGQVNNEYKFDLLSKNDLLVLTSHNENFANVVIESLSVGTPVLLSKNVGLASYVQDNNLGFVSDLKPQAIAEKIIEAFKDSSKRRRIRSEAPIIIQDHFKEEELIKRYKKLYYSI